MKRVGNPTKGAPRPTRGPLPTWQETPKNSKNLFKVILIWLHLTRDELYEQKAK